MVEPRPWVNVDGGLCLLNPPPLTQRLFWMLRVVTSLFIGAVILGECQMPQAWEAASLL